MVVPYIFTDDIELITVFNNQILISTVVPHSITIVLGY